MKTIKQIYESVVNTNMLPKNFYKKPGSCMYATELIFQHLIDKNITDFKIIEGYVSISGADSDYPIKHTWIELSNGDIIDETYQQFFSSSDDEEYMKSHITYLKDVDTFPKKRKIYTPDEYLKLCKKYPIKNKKLFLNKQNENN